MRMWKVAKPAVTATAVVTAILLGGSVLSACSSNSSTPTTTSGAAPARSTTTTRPATTTTSPGASTTSTAATGPARCATAALSGSVVGGSGAAGTIETTVALKNTASSACTLGGYPGMQMLAASGSPLPTVVVRKGNYPFTAMPVTTVTVGPGQSAYFNIGYSDVPVGNETTCPTSTSVQVTPPNAFDHLVMPAALSPCGGGSMTVSPVFLSTGANSQTTAPPSN